MIWAAVFTNEYRSGNGMFYAMEKAAITVSDLREMADGVREHFDEKSDVLKMYRRMMYDCGSCG